MIIDITTRNCTIGEHLKDVADSKLKKLDKYFEEEAEAKVVFKKEGATLTTEVMLNYAGKFIRATATSDNFYDNLDAVLPKIEGQIRKHRTKFDQHQKNMAFKEASLYDNGRYEDKSAGSVVKEKKFTLSPMTVEEAIEAMDLLGHSFYVFLEAKSNTVQVLYKRNDGDLGLIEPQI